MAKKYIVKWYDWNAGHYKEKECTSEKLNETFSKLNNKKGISDITITEVKTIELFKWIFTTLLPHLSSVSNL